MKKVLVFDLIFVQEHKSVNLNCIEALSKAYELTVISGNGYYDSQREYFKEKKINLIDINFKEKKGRIGSRTQSIDISNKTIRALKEKYDVAICLTFDTIVMPYQRIKKRLGTCELYLLHHRNIDELRSFVKSFFFSNYKNKVKHIVFENFFAQRLIEKKVKPNNIFVIPHPVVPKDFVIQNQRYDCVGLCNSNDEKFIDDILFNIERFIDNKIEIVLRSKLDRPDDIPSVKFIKDYLSFEEYDSFLSQAKNIFVPLPNTYIYRLSGSIYDALARRKIVLTTSKFYYEDFKLRYPGLCYYVKDVDSLLNCIVNQKRDDKFSESLKKFFDEHSISMLSSIFCKFIG